MTGRLFFLCGILYGFLIPCQAASPSRNPSQKQNVVPNQIIIRYHSSSTGGPGAMLQKIPELTQVLLSSRLERRIGSFTLEPLINPGLLKRLQSTSRVRDYFVLKYQRGMNYLNVKELLAQIPGIEEVEPVRKYSLGLQSIPDDPEYGNQDHLPQIQAPLAWDFTQGDERVIIAVVDNGFDMNHPDLLGNYFVNEPEADGLPGVDDDGNGLVDDISGYDFTEDDPDPGFGTTSSSSFRHGTHVAGIAAAVGNNGLGGAGVTWRCKILPIKVAPDNDPNTIFSLHGFRGISYAVALGAKVINMSWGSLGFPSQAEQDVIDMAYANGAVIVAAAGNSDSHQDHFPSSYHHVISVAAVDQKDHKAQFSNYGLSIDIAAPGISIFSTFPGGMYGSMSGTSMASPIVSGVAALVWSLHPDWAADKVMHGVVFSADSIDSRNPRFIDLLGSGRVNAYQAVKEIDFEPPPVKARLQQFSIDDSLYGNNNHLIESNETIAVFLELSNFSTGRGSQLQLKLRALNNPGLIWQNNSQTVFAPEDADFPIEQPFVFTMPQEISSEFLEFVLEFSGRHVLARTDTIVIQVGRYPILLVDDDDGKNNVEMYYQTPMKGIQLPFAYWNHSILGAPTFQYLQQFPIVVWLCEWAFPSLTPLDRAALSKYLSNNGNLFLSGQDIGWDLMDPASDNANENAREFYQNMLKADYLSDDAEESHVFGQPGDPIGDGTAFLIYQPGRVEEYQFPDIIAPLEPARAIFAYDHHKGAGGIRFQGEYRLVYLGFGLEAIYSKNSNPGELQDSLRTRIFYRILNYLHPLHHLPIPDQPVPLPSIPITAKYGGSGEFPQQVQLFYRTPGSENFQGQALSLQDSIFRGEIPLNNQEGVVEYYFQIDDPNFSWTLPVQGGAKPFQFRVGEDTIPPVVYPISIAPQLSLHPGYAVSASIHDNAALDSSAFFLKFQNPSGGLDSSTVIYQPAEGIFTGIINGDFQYGDTIFYWFDVHDLASPPNRSNSDTLAFVIGLDQFESGLGRWRNDSRDWGLDTLDAYSGGYYLKTQPFQDYNKNLDIAIATRDSIDLSIPARVELQFYSRYAIEAQDAGYVEFQVDDREWQIIAGPFSGFQGSWQLKRVNLTPFVGHSNCRLRFRFVSNDVQNTPLAGWMIDDVRIVQDEFITAVDQKEDEKIPAKFSLSTGYPNPFQYEVRFLFTLPRDQIVSISVFNILGQTIRSFELRNYSAGMHTLIWNGEDRFGEPSPAGIYFVQLSSGGYRIRKKIVLIH